MGMEAVKLLSGNSNINLRLLVLPLKKEYKKLRQFLKLPNVEIIEGDLCNIADIRKGVEGADYVLHLGALIPPAADINPELTDKINLGGTLNVIQAIKEQKAPDHIKLVYIATVAFLGNRPAPVHWGRTGDPIRISTFDCYGASKVRAERAVIESGLHRWVSLRQSGMLHEDMLRMMEPILFHSPLSTHIEWSTAEDSGRVLYSLCTKDLPDEFWRNIYNIGSGPEFRETFYDFTKNIFARIGIADIQKLFKPRDFATRNFHCVWYDDSDKLNAWLDFRRSTYSGFLKSLNIPSYYRLLRLLPGKISRKLIFEPLSRRAGGTRNWIENNITERIRAFWGSLENWEKIPEQWEDYRIDRVPDKLLLDHGWNEDLYIEDISLEDCRQAAEFRGGHCLSSTMRSGDIYTPLEWRCALGHEFAASPNAVLRAGHWCPECDTDVTKYEAQAEYNRFFAQVYLP